MSLPNRCHFYASRGTHPGSRLFVGDDLLQAPSDDLVRALARLDDITVPAKAMPAAFAMADGARVHLAIRCELGTLQLDWVEDHAPPGWAPVESFAKEAFAQFHTYLGEAG